MKKFHPKLFLILFMFWLLLTLNLEISNIIGGLLVSFIVTYLSFGILYSEKGFEFTFPGVFTIIKYFFILIFEIYISAIDLIKSIIKNEYNPSIIELKLNIKDPLLITLVANSITLTPGTITVDKNANHLTVIYIRADKDKKVEKNIRKKFERIFKTKD
ncbi:MAG: Na+/H+ antiporter subunit E [Senegalia sp. (in: firmicutes)]|uniref:Na+/H+ antiporter subunit E n=1 Tax=Senegalia sp. (in: firmicutes) TaxID=1924098 RepID=UPI003F99B1FB